MYVRVRVTRVSVVCVSAARVGALGCVRLHVATHPTYAIVLNFVL